MQGEYKNLLKKMIIIGVENPFEIIVKSEKDTEIRQAIIKKQLWLKKDSQRFFCQNCIFLQSESTFRM